MVVTTGFDVGMGHRLVTAWNESVPGDPITEERFRRLVLLDPNFDPEGLRIAHDGDEIVGAVYAVRRTVAMTADDLEPEQGWIPFLFTTPAHRRRGIGGRLLDEALDWLRGHGRRQADFSSYTPNYIQPGIDRERHPEAAGLLESRGFRTLYRASAMDMNLVGHTIPEKVRDRIAALTADGYTFGTPDADELVPLIRLAHEEFNPDWARAIREAAVAGIPLNRIVVARAPGGRVIGWGMCAGYESVIDRFGPFGVLADRRGLGLGEVLLHLCLERMRALGAHNAWFLWTGRESPAGHLYLKTGFTITRTFDVMRAPLHPRKDQS
ncbi:acetyltransferase (GNAT) family protein [Stackebrandtia albiflava]|uniref:Acetyltransferase (GNAT) family protein n=1 Tax=Stackebrandtia albiflava TaxID=406432 RepID=A0A562VE24_9ACTN|nr:GNAT family N-acetyltransferase [Stackebrandtia albiflava]TWJ16139.1 acetyltransferase (GNAT) family protein [Stackebrandtia albiflava]